MLLGKVTSALGRRDGCLPAPNAAFGAALVSSTLWRSLMRNLPFLKMTVTVFVLCFMAAMSSPAQTVTTLVALTGQMGGAPQGVLVQGRDGNFYATTEYNGSHAGGTAIRVTPAGSVFFFHNFCAQP